MYTHRPFFLSPGRDFIEEKLGSKYVVGRALDFAASFEESGPAAPMFFILSPGVDPLKDVESQGMQTAPWSQGCTGPMHCCSASVSFRFPDSRLILQCLIFAKHTEIWVITEPTPGGHHQLEDCSGV